MEDAIISILKRARDIIYWEAESIASSGNDAEDRWILVEQIDEALAQNESNKSLRISDYQHIVDTMLYWMEDTMPYLVRLRDSDATKFYTSDNYATLEYQIVVGNTILEKCSGLHIVQNL